MPRLIRFVRFCAPLLFGLSLAAAYPAAARAQSMDELFRDFEYQIDAKSSAEAERTARWTPERPSAA